MTDLLIFLIDAIHHAQKERGLSSLFLRDDNQSDRKDLVENHKLLDDAIAKLSENMRSTASPAGISGNWRLMEMGIKKLPERREKILNRRLAPCEAIAFYTFELMQPAMDLLGGVLSAGKAFDPSKASAFLHFMQMKERIGQERAEGVALLAKSGGADEDVSIRVKCLVEEQKSYETLFLKLAKSEQKQEYDQLKEKSPAFRKIDSINDAIAASGNVVRLTCGCSARDWFDAFTAKMDLLQEIAASMAMGLNGKNEGENYSVSSKAHLEKTIEDNLDNIKKLPLFAGIGDSALREIASQARISCHDDGNRLLEQGETVQRLYIVLAGWVKIFKNDTDGREAVIQILGTGENVLEPAVVNSQPAQANAQIVGKTHLFSLPAAALREHLESNKILAINMLSSLALQSSNFIAHIEQLTLRSAEQRIGWFLLKLRLSGDQKSLDINLPYDKSLIASLLGIKPETFSRALQSFRERGFDTGKHVLRMPEIHALCEFCDQDLAQHCMREEAERCRDGVFPANRPSSRKS